MCQVSGRPAGRAAVRHIASLGAYENKVGCHRRNLFVPVPSFHDVASFNERLLQDCLDLSEGKRRICMYKSPLREQLVHTGTFLRCRLAS